MHMAWYNAVYIFVWSKKVAPSHLSWLVSASSAVPWGNLSHIRLQDPLTVIQIAEYLAKTAKFIHDINTVDERFRASLFIGKKMIYDISVYARIVDKSSYLPEIEVVLLDLLRKGHEYCFSLNEELKKWETTLPHDNTPSSFASSAEKQEPHIHSSDHMTTPHRCIPVRMATERVLWCTQAVRRGMRSMFHRTHYQVIGGLSVTDAVRKLQEVRNELQLFVPIAENLHLLDADDDVIGFVSLAMQRIKSKEEPRRIPTSTLLKRRLLDPDPDCLFHVVTEGEFSGCILDLRRVGKDPDAQLVEDAPDLQRGENGPTALDATIRLAQLLDEDNQRAAAGTMDTKTQGTHTTLSTVGMPRCCGYSLFDQDGLHELVYKVPKTYKPVILRRLLSATGTDMHPIDDRFDFALKLVTAVHILHCASMVHKAICPDTILVMEGSPSHDSNNGHYILGNPYLAGFNRARYDNSETKRSRFSGEMRGRIYHHPRHLMKNDRPPYDMEDDIYSLGVCLFEIGIWRSMFYWYEAKEEYRVDPWVPDLFARSLEVEYEAVPGDIMATMLMKESARNAMRSDILRRLAAQMLPLKMGRGYAEVVLNCLNFRSGRREGTPIDTSQSAKRFVETVISKLRDARPGQRERI